MYIRYYSVHCPVLGKEGYYRRGSINSGEVGKTSGRLRIRLFAGTAFWGGVFGYAHSSVFGNMRFGVYIRPAGFECTLSGVNMMKKTTPR